MYHLAMKVMHLIQYEDFDPIEARMQYLLEALNDCYENTMDDSYLDAFYSIFDAHNSYQMATYPEQYKRPDRKEIIKKFVID